MLRIKRADFFRKIFSNAYNNVRHRICGRHGDRHERRPSRGSGIRRHHRLFLHQYRRRMDKIPVIRQRGERRLDLRRSDVRRPDAEDLGADKYGHAVSQADADKPWPQRRRKGFPLQRMPVHAIDSVLAKPCETLIRRACRQARLSSPQPSLRNFA
jgi:hypothetical protein